MKKLLSISLAALLAVPLFATGPNSFRKKGGGQQWIIIGARAGFSNTWLMSKNVMNDNGIKYKPSFGGGGGIMLGFHYSEWGAIEVEGLYSIYNQKFASGIDSLDWTSKTNLNYIEIPILLHFDLNNFKYLELGVKLGSLNSAKASFDYPKFSTLSYSNKDVKPNYEKSNMAVVFGWGTGLWGNGGLLINLGIRLSYGMADIVSDLGGKGDDYHPMSDLTKTQSYTKTNTATISLHMNMDFDLGWFVTSSCKRNHKFVLFGH